MQTRDFPFGGSYVSGASDRAERGAYAVPAASRPLGTYTGIDETETTDAATGRPTTSRGAAAVPLVHPAAMAEETRHHSFVFVNSPAYTSDPLKLAKTAAHRDPRFAALLDFVAPVGTTGEEPR